MAGRGRGRGGKGGRGGRGQAAPLPVGPDGRPLCPGHSEPCLSLCSRKDNSFGRRFWCCARPRDQPLPQGQCKCFQWDDGPPPTPSSGPAPAPAPSSVRLEVVGSGGKLRLRPRPEHPALASLVDDDGAVGFDDHDQARDMLAAAGVCVKVVPQLIRECFSAGNHGEEPSWDALDPPLWRRLFKYQQHGVDWALSKNCRGLIGDEMGLGKTVQALAVAAAFRSRWPCLVVCPATLRQSWANEASEWLGLGPLSCRIVKKSSDRLDGQALDIVSYDMVATMNQDLSARQYPLIICDESHSLKNLDTQRTQAVLPLLYAAPHVLLLSGTPALSRPKELWPQLMAIRPDLLADTEDNYRTFSERYCGGFEDSSGHWEDSGSSNLVELSLLLEWRFMIRRMKKDQLADMPSKQRETSWVDGDPAEQPRLDKLLEQIEECQEEAKQALTQEDKQSWGTKRKALDSRAYEATGRAKLKPCSAELERLVRSGVKLLCFAHHVNVLDGLGSHLQAHSPPVKFIRIDGHTNPAARQNLCDRFQSEPDCQVALLSLKCGGTGLTFTKASVVLFAEIDWVPGTLNQCEDRAHRVGQQSAVTVKYILCNNSLDNRMWQAVRRKLQVVNQTLDHQAKPTGPAASSSSQKPTSQKPPAAPPITTFFQPVPQPNQTTSSPSAPAASAAQQSPQPSGGAQSRPVQQSPLTPEQRARIDRNREAALQRRQRAAPQNNQPADIAAAQAAPNATLSEVVDLCSSDEPENDLQKLNVKPCAQRSEEKSASSTEPLYSESSDDDVTLEQHINRAKRVKVDNQHAT